MFKSVKSQAEGGRGFTLIELLVVIAIIAILAAILFPVFAQAKEAAKKTVCLSTEKQVTIASLLYANDYDDMGVFSLNILATPDRFELQSWYAMVYYNMPNLDGPYFESQDGLLYPYMKNQAIYGCPDSDPLMAGELSPLFPVGYGVNDQLMVFELTGWGFPPSDAVNYSAVAQPAETMLIADAAGLQDNGDGTASLSHQTWIDPPSVAGPYTLGIHHKQVNLGWVDGHSKSMPVSLRPNLSYYGGDAVLMKYAQQYNLGDIINPKYPYGSDWQDYYYRTDKPN